MSLFGQLLHMEFDRLLLEVHQSAYFCLIQIYGFCVFLFYFFYVLPDNLDFCFLRTVTKESKHTLGTLIEDIDFNLTENEEIMRLCH